MNLENNTLITVPVIGGHKFTWGVLSGSYGKCFIYKEDGTYIDFYNAEGNQRTIPLSSEAATVTATFVTSNLDNSFIKDATLGKYIWHGKNVK